MKQMDGWGLGIFLFLVLLDYESEGFWEWRMMTVRCLTIAFASCMAFSSIDNREHFACASSFFGMGGMKSFKSHDESLYFVGKRKGS
jgi:hypothetical protein